MEIHSQAWLMWEHEVPLEPSKSILAVVIGDASQREQLSSCRLNAGEFPPGIDGEAGEVVGGSRQREQREQMVGMWNSLDVFGEQQEACLAKGECILCKCLIPSMSCLCRQCWGERRPDDLTRVLSRNFCKKGSSSL